MTEQTPHLHRCACGTEWRCAKTDCQPAEECTRCADEAFALWAASQGLTDTQPPLEPEAALLGDGE